MAEIVMPLLRTVFLPPGSPGIGAINEIRTDIRSEQISSDGGKIYCVGEADLLIDYISFAGDTIDSAQGYMIGGGKQWQALLTMPFELMEPGELCCANQAKLTLDSVEWFMVGARALEMELNLKLIYEPKPIAEIAPAQMGIIHREQATSGEMVIDPLPKAVTKPPVWTMMTIDEQAITPLSTHQTANENAREGWKMVNLTKIKEGNMSKKTGQHKSQLKGDNIVVLSAKKDTENIVETTLTAQTKPESELGIIMKPAAETAGEAAPQSKPTAQAVAETAGEAAPQSKPLAQAVAEAAPQSKPTAEAVAETVAEAAPQSKPLAQAVAETVAEAAPQSKPTAEAVAETAPQSKPTAQAVAEAAPQSKPLAQTVTEAKSANNITYVFDLRSKRVESDEVVTVDETAIAEALLSASAPEEEPQEGTAERPPTQMAEQTMAAVQSEITRLPSSENNTPEAQPVRPSEMKETELSGAVQEIEDQPVVAILPLSSTVAPAVIPPENENEEGRSVGQVIADVAEAVSDTVGDFADTLEVVVGEAAAVATIVGKVAEAAAVLNKIEGKSGMEAAVTAAAVVAASEILPRLFDRDPLNEAEMSEQANTDHLFRDSSAQPKILKTIPDETISTESVQVFSAIENVQPAPDFGKVRNRRRGAVGIPALLVQEDADQTSNGYAIAIKK